MAGDEWGATSALRDKRRGMFNNLAIPSVSSDSRSLTADPSVLVRSSGIAITGGLVSQALKAVVMIFVARAFGTAQFGSFSFANSVNAFLFIIAQFGLPVFGARELAQAGKLERGLLKAIAEARLLLAIAGSMVVLAVLYFVSQMTREEFWMVAGFGLSNVAMSGLFDWAFQGMGRLHLWAATNIICQGMWLAFTLVIVHERASITLVAFAYAAAALVAALIGWPWLRRITQRPTDRASVPFHSVRSVIVASANLGASTLLITVLVWTDTIIVRLVQGQHAAGVYAAGNRVALALAMLASFYVLGAFPKLSQSALSSPSQFRDSFQQAYENLALLFIPGIIWGLFYAPQIMLMLFKNPDYLAGVTVFRVFQVFLLLNVVSNLYGMGGLVACCRDHAYRQALSISAVALLVLCPILTVKWGLMGAALAALFSQGLNLVLFMAETRAIICAEHFKALGLPIVIGAIPIIVGELFAFGFWTSAAALFLTYLGILIWRRPVAYAVAG